jgi:hypothetical protein
MKSKDEVTLAESIIVLGGVFLGGLAAVGLILGACIKYLFWG